MRWLRATDYGAEPSEALLQQAYVDATVAILDTRREALEALLQLRALNGGTALDR